MISLLSDFESHFHEYLTANQFQTLSILISLINQYRQVKIEKLAGYFPLPIQFESRRKHLQRFLVLTALSVPLIWFPIISTIIAQKIPSGKSLVVAIDRTQWQNKNIFLITLIYNHHGLPLYWKPLDKKGASNLAEQKSLIRPIIKLLKNYHIIIIGDREFHSVELSKWLKNQKKKGKKVDFALRQKAGTFYHQGGGKYRKLSEIEVIKGVKQIKMGIKVTKKRGFGSHNLSIYHKKNKGVKKMNEPWYILTSLDNVEEVIKVYQQRMGIEIMFKDYKKGGYNIEESKANEQRLTSLLLLIAIGYTNQTLKGKIIKIKGMQKYIGRVTEKKRKIKRNSDFWVGLYGEIWINNYDNYQEEVEKIMARNKNKQKFYQQGIKVKEKLEKLYSESIS
jgi:hypothetical protein